MHEAKSNDISLPIRTRRGVASMYHVVERRNGYKHPISLHILEKENVQSRLL